LSCIRFLRPRSGAAGAARRRLFCFPYAGGGSGIFRLWPDLLPGDTELGAPILPGRETRVNEASIADMGALVDLLAEAIEPHLDLPYALFGHSLGAFVAFDLAHEIARRGWPAPLHLFVSAQRGPGLPYRAQPIYELSDTAFLDKVSARYGGLPTALASHAEFMAVLTPILRADFKLVETYRRRAPGPLSCPITAFGGVEDTFITPDKLDAWSVETSAGFARRMAPGGHFFIETERAWLLAQIRRDLTI
jgi:medium-chain acyl-[acyl-carrier-protein] hydrolase